MCYIKETIPTIGDYNEGNINKLNVLKEARRIGLIIPETIISSSKTAISKANPMITKAIKDGFRLSIDNNLYHLKTHRVVTDEIPDYFAPTLFQKEIEKKFELRIFYIDGIFYSMVIFSQQDSRTEVDFRNYDYQNPTKTSPYQLPHEIELKLKELMKNLKLSTGSIDMIYTVDNDYCFLEVNPTGQFGMISIPCNYMIEKRIAELL